MQTKEEELFIKNTFQGMLHGKSSKFLNQREYQLLLPFLNKEKLSYHVFTYCKTESDSYFLSMDKILLYMEDANVVCFEIHSNKALSHQDILGSIFSLSIDIHNFGDILIMNGHYYILVLKELANYVEANLCMIGNSFVTLEEVPLETISSYQRQFLTIPIITSSLRIDTMIARLSKLSRKKALELLKEKKVLLNYSDTFSTSTLLKENDIISIRRVGKFYLSSIDGNTKSGKFIITMKKYQ